MPNASSIALTSALLIISDRVDFHLDCLRERVQKHRTRNGAKLMEAVRKNCISWHVSRVWDGDYELEHILKRKVYTNRKPLPPKKRSLHINRTPSLFKPFKPPGAKNYLVPAHIQFFKIREASNTRGERNQPVPSQIQVR
jgi:hypothetical protein